MVKKKSDDDEDEANLRYGRSPRMREYRQDVIRTFKRHYGEDLLQVPGYYFGTVEVQWQCEGTIRQGNFVVSPPPGQPVVDGAFTLAIGDTSLTWFSANNQPHVITPADTNLQNPGQNLYQEEVFIIEAVSARQRGMSIAYSQEDILSIRPAPTGNTLQMLLGNQMLRDERGVVIPAELFNKYDDSFRLAKTLEEIATLNFVWRDYGAGGSNRVWNRYIDSFLNVTDNEKSLARTSGGAAILDLPEGFLWCLDKQFQTSIDSGGNGLFDAELQLHDGVSAPFTPIRPFGSASPLLPLGMAFYWEIRLHGTSLLPANHREEKIRRVVEARVSR